MQFAAIPDIVIGLGLLVGFLAAYGTLYGYTYSLGALLRGLAWFLGNLKVNVWFVSVNVGTWLEKEVKKLDHAIQHVLGAWVAQMDSALGAFLHANALLWEHMSAFVEGVYPALTSSYEWIIHHRVPAFVRSQTQAITHDLAVARGKVNAATKDIAKIDARAKTAAKALPHTISHAVAVALPGINGRVGTLEREIPGLRSRVKTLEKHLTGLGLAALGVAMLAKLGLSWLRCPSLTRLGRKIGCGGFSFLESLFAEAFEALLVLDLCRFALGAQRLARLLVPQLGAVLLVQNAVCLGGGATLPSASDRPRVSTRITLPSAHD